MSAVSTEKDAVNKKYLGIIAVVGVLIPVVVALLLFIPQTGKLGDVDVSFLPHFNGVLNSLTAVSLFFGYRAIKSGNREAHKKFMFSAFMLSSVFLVSYVIYHFQAPPTLFGDTDHNGAVDAAEKAAAGGIRTFYLVLLASHIVLAAIIVPMVLTTIYFAVTEQFDRHKKIAKFTYPTWLYVSVTGVICYLMISQYYI
jgi:putative membrane protein